MENIFSEKVTKLNDNIDQMASQLSSLGKDIESRAMSLHNNIQVLLIYTVVVVVRCYCCCCFCYQKRKHE